jgi:DNA-directed RNA polymerase subunit RPC12/RpoP
MDFQCNHCKEGIDINDFELFELYDKDEDLKEIPCPHCNVTIYVQPCLSWSFNVTDEDGDDIYD